MGEKARLTVALDMLIEYLLQADIAACAVDADRPCAGQQCGSYGLDSCTAAQLSKSARSSTFAENG
jgi:hypothetical protein